MDDLDRAQTLEEREREDSIKAARKELEKSLKKSQGAGKCCEDCGEEIERARLAVGCFKRCISCQTLRERRGL